VRRIPASSLAPALVALALADIDFMLGLAVPAEHRQVRRHGIRLNPQQALVSPAGRTAEPPILYWQHSTTKSLILQCFEPPFSLK
jgi:hypothetical protein